MTTYKMHMQVLSHHCDGTGIVHFPRFSEMALQVVENWFDEALDWSFARMMGRDNAGVPVVRNTADFDAASRLGDHLVWTLHVAQIGRSSVTVGLQAKCGGEARARMQLTLVHSDLGVVRPRAWPDVARARMADFIMQSAAQ